MAIQFKLDNEFDLVYAVVYQKVIKLAYVDSFLSNLQNAFKDKFGDILVTSQHYGMDYDFDGEFRSTLSIAENSAKQNSKAPKAMRSFNESLKSKKTVASMIETPNDCKKSDITKKVNIVESPKVSTSDKTVRNEDIIMENRKKLREKLSGKKSPQPDIKAKAEKEKAGKKPRVWDLGGSSKDAVVLDRSKDHADDVQYKNVQNNVSFYILNTIYVKQFFNICM